MEDGDVSRTWNTLCCLCRDFGFAKRTRTERGTKCHTILVKMVSLPYKNDKIALNNIILRVH